MERSKHVFGQQQYLSFVYCVKVLRNWEYESHVQCNGGNDKATTLKGQQSFCTVISCKNTILKEFMKIFLLQKSI